MLSCHLFRRPCSVGGLSHTLAVRVSTSPPHYEMHLLRFGILFVAGPPSLGVHLLRFGGHLVAGPPRWRGTCHSFQPFSCLIRRPCTFPGGAPDGWGCSCYVLGPFSCLVHHPWRCACYVLGVFRGRSAAVGRDLPRFGALFVPGPPPLGVRLLHFGVLFVAGPPRWGGTCHVLGPFSRLVHRPCTFPGGAPATFWAFFVAGPPRWGGPIISHVKLLLLTCL